MPEGSASGDVAESKISVRVIDEIDAFEFEETFRNTVDDRATGMPKKVNALQASDRAARHHQCPGKERGIKEVECDHPLRRESLDIDDCAPKLCEHEGYQKIHRGQKAALQLRGTLATGECIPIRYQVRKAGEENFRFELLWYEIRLKDTSMALTADP